MSSFFDKLGSRIYDLRKGGFDASTDAYKEFEEIEHDLVDNILVCISFHNFPEDLRQRAYKIILEFGSATLPYTVRHSPRADVESFEEQLSVLDTFVSRMHDLFHDVAHRFDHEDCPQFTDHPLVPIRQRISEGWKHIRELSKTTGQYIPIHEPRDYEDTWEKVVSQFTDWARPTWTPETFDASRKEFCKYLHEAMKGTNEALHLTLGMIHDLLVFSPLDTTKLTWLSEKLVEHTPQLLQGFSEESLENYKAFRKEVRDEGFELRPQLDS